MSAAALIFTLALMAADAPASPAPQEGEPLPAGAPTQDYPLTAWCYGAMDEYLAIYERVKPDLKAIDKMFGSSEPHEPEPYASDMAAAHVELKVLADAVTAAEKASPSPIAPQGAAAIKLGQSVWAPAEAKTSRELARAWLSWALPDRCDSTARSLAQKSALLGQALKYNTPPPSESDAGAAPPAEAPAAPSDTAALPSSEAPATPTPAPPAAGAPPDASTSPPGAEPSAQSPAAGDTPLAAGQAPAEAAAPPTAGAPQTQQDQNAPIPDPTPHR